MGQVDPPVGVRGYHQARADVLEAVTALAGTDGMTRIPDINIWLEERATVLTHWHLLILGDHGKVEWVAGPGDHGVASYVRLRKDAA